MNGPQVVMTRLQTAVAAAGDAGGRKTFTNHCSWLQALQMPLSVTVKLKCCAFAGGSGGGWRWWREEDPYWPLRDWGDHPMRWWTWGLAAALAAGGVLVHAQTGCASAVHVGIGSGALLGMAAVAMSDMRGGNPLGELGVKAAFGEFVCSQPLVFWVCSVLWCLPY
jgi:hypothetical protein